MNRSEVKPWINRLGGLYTSSAATYPVWIDFDYAHHDCGYSLFYIKWFSALNATLRRVKEKALCVSIGMDRIIKTPPTRSMISDSILRHAKQRKVRVELVGVS